MIVSPDVTPAGFWPITLVGWLTTVGVILTVAIQLISMGKFLEKLNGFGKRLGVVEDKSAWLRGKSEEGALINQRIVDEQGRMAEKIGEATQMTKQCSTETEAMGHRIEDQLRDMARQISGIDKTISERLSGVEAVLKQKG